MKVTPYIDILGAPFGALQEAVLTAFGAPMSESVNRLNQSELSYKDVTFRFSPQPEGKLIEATVCSEFFQIKGCNISPNHMREISFRELGFVVAKLDIDSFVAQGFIVSPKFGLAFDPNDECALTVFSRSELAEWQRLA